MRVLMRAFLILLFLLPLFSAIIFGNSTNNTLIIAHRGASAYEEAHTFEAYDLALNMGTDFLELDVQMTKDQELVITHDEVPVSGIDKWISAYTLAELRQIIANDGSHIKSLLTLNEVIDRYPQVPLYIEIKHPVVGVEKRLMEVLKTTGRLNRPDTLIFQSFSLDSLTLLNSLAPNIFSTYLISSKDTEDLTKEQIEEIPSFIDGIGVSINGFDPIIVDFAHERGLVVHVYTVNNLETMKDLLRNNVDGLFTDAPDILYKVLDRSKGAH